VEPRRLSAFRQFSELPLGMLAESLQFDPVARVFRLIGVVGR